MRVLVPMPYDLSSLAHGRNLRIVHLLRRLANDCQVTCLTPNGAEAVATRRAIPNAEVRGVNRHGNPDRLPLVWAPAARKHRNRWIGAAISFFGYDAGLLTDTAEQSGDYDVVLGFDLPSVVYLLAAGGHVDVAGADRQGQHPSRQAGGVRPRTVCDLIDDPLLLHNSRGMLAKYCPAGLKTTIAVRILRTQVLPTLDALIAVAPRDAASLSQAAERDVIVVPNGVEADDQRTSPGAREPLVVFTGAMDFPPNEVAACHLVRNIWPEVLQHLSQAHNRMTHDAQHTPASRLPTLALVGANPTQKVRKLATGDGPGQVMVTGRVDDLRAWLRRAQVAVAPMISGSGMKNKVLEAAAAGCPVVCTPMGGSGLPTGRQHGIITALRVEQFSRAVADLVLSPETADAIGRAGRITVRRRFSWEASAAQMLDVLRDGVSTATITRRGIQRPAEAGTPAPDKEEAIVHAAS